MSYLDNTLSSSSSEEELLNLVRMLPKPKVYHARFNPMVYYEDVEFKMRYRFSKEVVQEILEMCDINSLQCTNNKNYPISPINQLLLTLRFYATGCFQQVVGDHMHIDKSTVCRIIPRVTQKIAAKAVELIQMPNTQAKKQQIIAEFYKIARFPRVIGAIDCTHIRITSPGGENAEIFRNRKGWFSINVQVVCDAQLRIRDVVARWPGSSHDSTIFNSSALRAKFEADEYEQCWLLGDNGYACKDYLLTPFLNPRTPGEERYNRSHIQTRNTIERTFGILKRRFPCLQMGLRIKVERAVEVIVATAVLNNIAINLKDSPPPADDIPEVVINEIAAYQNNVPARSVLVNTVFSR